VTVTVFENAEALGAAVAGRIAMALRANPSLVLGLPAGRTPLPTYAALRQLFRQRQVDFSGASTFALDEFVGLPADHPSAFRRVLETHMLQAVNVSAARAHFLDGAAADLDEECRRYEAAIARAGGLGLQLLGIGRNGHIGFNEPSETLSARTHRVDLHEATRADNAHLFGGRADEVPREGLSMGMATIAGAAVVMLIATGEEKADAIAAAVEGPLTTRVPASLLQLHARTEVYLDREAASRLGLRAR
jgi:glucosamine-6-phosphate deaminase